MKDNGFGCVSSGTFDDEHDDEDDWDKTTDGYGTDAPMLASMM